MAAASKSALPPWAEHALNGVSYRKARPWVYEPGDTLAGAVVEVREVTVNTSRAAQLVCRVEGGTTAGAPLEVGEWISFNCVGSVLRRWIEKESPAVGDRVCEYRIPSSSPGSRPRPGRQGPSRYHLQLGTRPRRIPLPAGTSSNPPRLPVLLAHAWPTA